MSQDNPNWDDDGIQFPRLLAEIHMTQDLDYEALRESMDLDQEDLDELFDRALRQFDEIKEEINEETP
jgi:hypothetical protein